MSVWPESGQKALIIMMHARSLGKQSIILRVFNQPLSWRTRRERKLRFEDEVTVLQRPDKII